MSALKEDEGRCLCVLRNIWYFNNYSLWTVGLLWAQWTLLFSTFPTMRVTVTISCSSLKYAFLTTMTHLAWRTYLLARCCVIILNKMWASQFWLRWQCDVFLFSEALLTSLIVSLFLFHIFQAGWLMYSRNIQYHYFFSNTFQRQILYTILIW